MSIITTTSKFIMTDEEWRQLEPQLVAEDRKRQRGKYIYTVDALTVKGCERCAVWAELNATVRGIIAGTVDYDGLPIDETNEILKGALWMEQQDILMQNSQKELLCEAQSMKPCLKEQCMLYNSKLGPPICREFKMAFRK